MLFIKIERTRSENLNSKNGSREGVSDIHVERQKRIFIADTIANKDKIFNVRKTGSRSRTRTYDRAVNSRLLYQLSYPGPVGSLLAKAAAEGNRGGSYPPCATRSGRHRRVLSPAVAETGGEIRLEKFGMALPGLEPGCPQGRAIFVPLRLSPPHAGSWSGLSLRPVTRLRSELGAARPVSTPSRLRAWLGISSEAFPDFERFYSGHFHPGTQFTMSRVRLPFRQRAGSYRIYRILPALQRAGRRAAQARPAPRRRLRPASVPAAGEAARGNRSGGCGATRSTVAGSITRKSR